MSIDRKDFSMMKLKYLGFAVALGVVALLGAGSFNQTYAQGNTPKDFVAPTVFQAAGPNSASIQSTVDGFRAALGITNNGNTPGPLGAGHREINWDGGGVDTTTAPVTPFNVFLNTRGAQFTT